jgi:isoquinoline 1-oxidoreductase alpha subunit
MIKLTINGKSHSIDAEDSATLLWILRDQLELTGTKYGCGQGSCGACTVHVNGKPVRACLTSMSAVEGATVTTIEGVGSAGNLHPVQKAWIAEQVPQCGYCQSGQIMSAVALLQENLSPSREEIVAAMDGNLCRCGAYLRIVKAIQRAAAEVRDA